MIYYNSHFVTEPPTMRSPQPLFRLLGALLLAAVALGSVISSAHYHHDSPLESPACEVCVLGTLKHGAVPTSPALIVTAPPATGAHCDAVDAPALTPLRPFAARAPPVHYE